MNFLKSDIINRPVKRNDLIHKSRSKIVDMGQTPTERRGASAQPDDRSDSTATAAPVHSVGDGLYQKGYVLEKTIGSGAYSKVKLAHSARLNRKVAIKIIEMKKAPKDVLEKFLPREEETLNEMSHHDNIVTIHDVVKTAEKICFVMDLAENGDLLDYINSKKRLSERTARTFFRDLVTAVAACHKRKIVHRDIKCENLLLDANYRLKLSDFGFARKSDRGSLLDTFCGSFAYAAPEIIVGEDYIGTAADIWSMGVVLFAMVCGKLPFRDTDARTLLSQISKGLSYGTTEPSINCRDLLTKILVYSPKERLTTEDILSHPWMKEDPEK